MVKIKSDVKPTQFFHRTMPSNLRDVPWVTDEPEPAKGYALGVVAVAVTALLYWVWGV